MTTIDPDTTADDTVEAPPVDPNAVNITVNGVPHVARKGQLVIEAAADAGEYIPRFCYHERMTSVGKCRMCLVECDTGRGPAVTVSCMVPVAPDMKVDTQSETTKRMQEGVLELLLANHPLDCPVCDKGGECPLQDQTLSNGPGESRYVEEKRHYEKPIAISDIVLLDRERCILCDRCTRFADEVAGDPLIHFNGRGNNTHITTYPDEPFSSYFSGNTVQICPVGALTAKPYRFKARPWDLSQQESTCTTCAVGCRTVVQSSRDEVLRYMGVDSEPVNHGWLCDRGRFNFESVKSPDRVLQPLVRDGDQLQPSSWNAALAAAAALITEATAAGGANSIAVLGGARGSNEDAFAWARLGHEVIGTPNVYAQMGDGLPAGLLGQPRATIDQAAHAATIVLLGPDLKEELPVLYLRLREAAEKRWSRIIEFTPKRTGLSPYAWRTIGYEPGTQVAAVQQALADPAIAAQIASGDVVVVAGRANLAESSAATVAALRELLAAVPSALVLPAFRRGNVVGALQVGMRPRPGGLDTRSTLQAAADGKIECLVLVGADPLADFPDTDLARRGLAGARRIIAVDSFLTASSSLAHVVLAASAYTEKSGTTTNIEGRVSTLARQVTPAGNSRADWMIAGELALALGGDLGYDTVDDITADIATLVDGYAEVTIEALAASTDGVVAGVPSAIDPMNVVPVDLPDRNAYDFRLVVSRTMYDQATGTANSPSLAHLPRGSAVHLHPLDIERVGTTAGTEVKVIGPRATVVFAVVADESVLRGTAWVPFNNPGPNVGDLIDCFAAVNDVRIENI
ncbi:MAG: NADH-quinone oxidoreductase subunit NuoG [Actinomycetota bacterium]|nr:NADH-quinone oxidoreductase subunit NuoG [Actinomycetota bacterium]